MQLKEFVKYINPSTLDLVTIKGKVSKINNALVLICYEG